MNKPKSIINIVLTADKNYIDVITVLICSILENLNKNVAAKFFVFSQGFNNNDLIKFELIKEKYNCEIINVPMDKYINLFNFIDTSKFKNTYISLACYFRLLIFKILPEDIETCFFIDGDMIVNCDLSEISLENEKIFAAVIEPHAMQYRERILSHCYGIEDFSKFTNEPLKYPYFNAGFFFTNVKKAKQLNIFDDFIDFLSRHPNPPYADQDTLNAIFGQKYFNLVQFLPPEYNMFCTVNYKIPYDRLPYDKKELSKASKSPKIIHYAGPNKPWNTMDIKNYYSEWWKYYNCVPNNKNKLLKQYRTWLNTPKKFSKIPVVGFILYKFIPGIFSIKNKDNNKIITLLFFKFPIERKKGANNE